MLFKKLLYLFCPFKKTNLVVKEDVKLSLFAPESLEKGQYRNSQTIWNSTFVFKVLTLKF